MADVMESGEAFEPLFEIRTNDLGVIRLVRWPEGLVLWVDGQIRWKSWADSQSRRGALKAMREPTEPMIDAAFRAVETAYGPHASDWDPITVWQAMVDAAIKDD